MPSDMTEMSALPFLLAGAFVTITTILFRSLYLISSSAARSRPSSTDPQNTSHMVVVLGSGGHTAEMMSLLRDIDMQRYTRRTYIVSSGDTFSSSKAEDFENLIQSNYAKSITKVEIGTWEVRVVPRARRIHQSLYTAPFSALWCLFGCLRVLYNTSTKDCRTDSRCPDVIITNGPATAVIVILAANLLKFLGLCPLWKMRTVYVESWARVKTLSLSGKMLLHMGICDRFLVQWETLATAINGSSAKRKVEWAGFLVE